MTRREKLDWERACRAEYLERARTELHRAEADRLRHPAGSLLGLAADRLYDDASAAYVSAWRAAHGEGE